MLYDLISALIDHSWQTNSSDQQYIYYACIAAILLFSVVFIDLVYRFISSIFKF